MTESEAEQAVTERVPADVKSLFAKYVPGRSFGDLGCMWNADGAYAFYAERIGARPPLMALDINDRTPRYLEYERALRSKVRFRQESILELTPEGVGTYETVFCSGIFYHMPDPVLALGRVLGICSRFAILVTHTLRGDDERLTFYPFSRRPETFPWERAYPRGREERFEIRYGDFGPWWFGFTESVFENMMRLFRFKLREKSRYILELAPGAEENPQFTLFVAERDA